MTKKILAFLLSILLAFSCFTVIPFAVDNDVMRFGSDGKFKIVVFADTQDTDNPSQEMLDFMGQALDDEQPDLVVFTGDNVVVDSESRFAVGAAKLIQPLIDRDVPYAYTFGNHDAENVSKTYMHSVYKTLGRCLTYNADDSIYGYGNCNIPIYSSTGNSMAFNLWIIDSNMYPSSGSGYDYVHTDQINWFTNTDAAIEASEGHKVNSLVFQHIVVPEVYNCLKTTSSLSNSKKYNGKRYACELNSTATGYLGEFPCPPNTNNGEFQALKDRGDVIGIVTGHDHSNSFVGTYQGIDFIQMPGMTYYSYGDSNARGYGVIELNENDTTTYSSYTVRYIDAYRYIVKNYNGVNDNYYRYNSGTYISDIRCAQNDSSSSAKSELTSAGYTVIDFDLNKDAGGQYVYMGYKTTTDPNNAIKDIRFFSELSDMGSTVATVYINGKGCQYTRDTGADLNKGSGGDYIYACFTKDANAGAPITSISFSIESTGTGKVCGKLGDPDTPADLNNGTGKHENAVYCFTQSSATIINSQVNELKSKYNQLSTYLDSDSFNDSSKAEFESKMSVAKAFLDDIETCRVTDKSDSVISTMKTEIMDSCASLVTGVTEGEFLYGIASNSSLDSVLDRFNNGYVTATVQPSSSRLGTGSVVTLTYEGRTKTYTTVIFGDINGDSWYDGQDAAIASCIAGGMLTEAQVGAAAYAAADCNHDGVVDGADVELLNNAGILLANVDQTKSNEELLMTSSDYVEYISIIDQNPVISEGEDEPEAPLTFWGRVKAFFERIFNWFSSVFSAFF